MKYTLLNEFHRHLQRSYASSSTAQKYLSVAKRLFDGLQFNGFADLPPEAYINALDNVKTPKQKSEARQVFKQIKAFCPAAAVPVGELFNEITSGGFRRPKIEKVSIDASRVKRTINALPDHRLKLAYRLALASGLRVSELASLGKGDISIEDGIIKVSVQRGKGGKSDVVACLPDHYLVSKLLPMLDAASADDSLFYSAKTLKNEAYRHNFECHDLRRIAAQTLLATAKAAGMGNAAARKQVQKFLRHSRISTTKRYLWSRKRRFTGIKPLKQNLHINMCEDALCVTDDDTNSD